MSSQIIDPKLDGVVAKEMANQKIHQNTMRLASEVFPVLVNKCKGDVNNMLRVLAVVSANILGSTPADIELWLKNVRNDAERTKKSQSLIVGAPK